MCFLYMSPFTILDIKKTFISYYTYCNVKGEREIWLPKFQKKYENKTKSAPCFYDERKSKKEGQRVEEGPHLEVSFLYMFSCISMIQPDFRARKHRFNHRMVLRTLTTMHQVTNVYRRPVQDMLGRHRCRGQAFSQNGENVEGKTRSRHKR